MMYKMPDMTFIFYLAMFGLVMAALLAIGGAGFVIYFLAKHVVIV